MRRPLSSSTPDQALDLLDAGKDLLTPLEKLNIQFVRRTFEPGPLNSALQWGQRKLGATWIDVCTRNLLHVSGLERLPSFDAGHSFICVSNHRSFFDLYVVAALLVRRGLSQRLIFPVRSHFFYDNPLGFFVNGIMSFFAMYPPVFRDNRRLALNPAGVGEVIRLLRGGGTFAGMHPEGTRKKDGDPYTFLPSKSGVGRIIHSARVPVVPVFINGLGNDLVAQVTGNFTRKGPPIITVFGGPVDFGGLLDEAPTPALYRDISARALDAIARLSEEERELRRTGYGARTVKN